ncbi:M14 family zinc carboxypeptidase [Acidovorax lacteus]
MTPIPAAVVPSMAASGDPLAARFPAPAVVYQTPGLAPHRRALTTLAELADWIARLGALPENARGTRAHPLALGNSARGEPIVGVLIGRVANASPASVDATGKPVIALVGQQQGTDGASAEALLHLAQELARGELEPLLDRIHVLLVPRANPDGAAHNTAGTSSSPPLDADHLALQTPEARALARVLGDYRAAVLVESREYDASQPYLEPWSLVGRADALVQYASPANYPEFLRKAAAEWFAPALQQGLQAERLSSDPFHRLTGATPQAPLDSDHLNPARLANAQALRNSIGLVVASRRTADPMQDLQRRVHTQVVALTAVLRQAAERAASLEQVRTFVARETSAQACREPAVLRAEARRERRDLTLLDPRTGAEQTVSVEWDNGLAPQARETRTRPCGYWLAADNLRAVEQLRALGLPVLRIAEPGSVLSEGNGLQRRAIDTPAGSYYAPLNHGLALLTMAAVEPVGDAPGNAPAGVARVLSPPALVFDEAP